MMTPMDFVTWFNQNHKDMVDTGKKKKCKDCRGKGEKPCPICKGLGEIQEVDCQACDGSGEAECKLCNGDGEFIVYRLDGQKGTGPELYARQLEIDLTLENRLNANPHQTQRTIAGQLDYLTSY